MNFPLKFLTAQIQPVVDRLNAGTDPLLNSLFDSWLRSGQDHGRWKRGNPELVKKFERVTKLSANFDDTISFFLRVAYAPPKIQVSRCGWRECERYFIVVRKDRNFCCAEHRVKFQTEQGPVLEFAKKLASIPLLLKNLSLDADWKSHLAKKGISRWFATRAVNNGFLNDNGELTQKAFDLFDHLRFPWK